VETVLVIDLIYCSSGNKVLNDIAVANGFKPGLRLPTRTGVNPPVYFTDQDWKNPDKHIYMELVKKYTPHMATVLDLEYKSQLDEVLAWATEISSLANKIVFIPKCTGVISKLPRDIAGKETLLGYSVPSKYGATELPYRSFRGWKVHLLGGAPEKQIICAHEMNVVSLDCNWHSYEANKFGMYWTGKYDDTRWWRDYNFPCADRKEKARKAFELSCKNIVKYWRYLDLFNKEEI
jgi:hypothetical protein